MERGVFQVRDALGDAVQAFDSDAVFHADLLLILSGPMKQLWMLHVKVLHV